MNQSSTFTQGEKTPKTGGVADPAEVKRAILEAIKDIKRTERDFEKLTADKEELLADLAELRTHEKQVEEKTLPASVKKVIERSIRALQKRLSAINGVLPEVDFSADQKKIQKIVAEWKEGKRNFRNAYGAHLRAERKLAENPVDHRAIGDANRSEAEMYAESQKMDTLAKEAEITALHMEPNPVTDEAVNIHTGEEIKVPTVLQENEEVLYAPEISPGATITPSSVSLNPVEEEGIYYTHEQALKDQRRPRSEPVLQGEVENHEAFTNLLPPSAELPPPETHELLEDHLSHGSHEKDVESVSSYSAQPEEVPKIVPEEVVLSEEPEIKEPAQEEVEMPTEIPEQKEAPVTPAIEPELVEFVPETESAPVQEVGDMDTSLVSEYREVPEEAPIKEEKPGDPSARAYAENALRTHLDKLFGTKGVLGFGGVRGENAPHWTDPAHGFAKKTVEEVFNASPGVSPDSIGIQNALEVGKMRAYIEKAEEDTFVHPLPYETMSGYITRALIAAYESSAPQK